MGKVTSVRLSDELAARVERLAAALDRPKSWLIEQAIARYVEEEERQVQAIADALAAYRRGEAPTRPHAEVMERLGAKVREHGDDACPLA